jgi:hypothetical protein
MGELGPLRGSQVIVARILVSGKVTGGISMRWVRRSLG